jgi:hypothetical protein
VRNLIERSCSVDDLKAARDPADTERKVESVTASPDAVVGAGARA